MLRKKIIILLMAGMCFAGSINCMAMESATLVTNTITENNVEAFSRSGYTVDHIFYEVSGENVIYGANYVIVERTVSFQGDVEPNESIYWEEYIGGELYAGVLSLVEYEYYKNVTTAVYSGTLYKRQTAK